MHAVIFYLTTFGYIDGDFDATEKSFVRDYIGKLVAQRADDAMPERATSTIATEVVDKFTDALPRGVRGHRPEREGALHRGGRRGRGPERRSSTRSSRCAASRSSRASIAPGQEQLMATHRRADHGRRRGAPGRGAVPRASSRRSSRRICGIELVEDDEAPRRPSKSSRPEPASRASRRITRSSSRSSSTTRADPEKLSAAGRRRSRRSSIASIDAARPTQRKRGAGKLTGKKTVAELAGERAVPRRSRLRAACRSPGRKYELTVLGDLHGCYSVLKATLHAVGLLRARSTRTGEDPNEQPRAEARPARRLHRSRSLQLNGVLRTVAAALRDRARARHRAARQPRVLRRVQGQRCTAA